MKANTRRMLDELQQLLGPDDSEVELEIPAYELAAGAFLAVHRLSADQSAKRVEKKGVGGVVPEAVLDSLAEAHRSATAGFNAAERGRVIQIARDVANKDQRRAEVVPVLERVIALVGHGANTHGPPESDLPPSGPGHKAARAIQTFAATSNPRS